MVQLEMELALIEEGKYDNAQEIIHNKHAFNFWTEQHLVLCCY